MQRFSDLNSRGFRWSYFRYISQDSCRDWFRNFLEVSSRSSSFFYPRSLQWFFPGITAEIPSWIYRLFPEMFLKIYSFPPGCLHRSLQDFLGFLKWFYSVSRLFSEIPSWILQIVSRDVSKKIFNPSRLLTQIPAGFFFRLSSMILLCFEAFLPEATLEIPPWSHVLKFSWKPLLNSQEYSSRKSSKESLIQEFSSDLLYGALDLGISRNCPGSHFHDCFLEPLSGFHLGVTLGTSS